MPTDFEGEIGHHPIPPAEGNSRSLKGFRNWKGILFGIFILIVMCIVIGMTYSTFFQGHMDLYYQLVR